MNDLRAAIIVDYQNVHLVGHGLYDATRNLPRHKTLIDPLLFAQRLLRARNGAQKPGMPNAALRSVEVFSGHRPRNTTAPATHAARRRSLNGNATRGSL